MKKINTFKAKIKKNDKTFIGKKLLFAHMGGSKIGTIIAVTTERVIWVDDFGNENWCWISPNGKEASFDVVYNGRNMYKFRKAIELEEAYNSLVEENNKLKQELDILSRYKKIADILEKDF